MKVLVTGKGTSGSWQIRGEQLGRAIGATVQLKPERPEEFDVAVLVKRPTPELLRRLGRVPIVWDVVDSWPQPHGNDWGRETAMSWMRGQIAAIRPVAFVAATRSMAVDLEVFGLPVLALPHHARPGQELNPVRERVHKVGYQGGPHYIDYWRPVIEAECRRRKWTFVVNPDVLADVDIVVGLRDSRGYPVRHWKSNVKLANAQGTGTPCVMSPECGYMETQSGAEAWAEDERGLAASFDMLEQYPARSVSSRILLTAAPHLDQVAHQFRTWLEAEPWRS